MTRNLFYLLMLICSAGIFTACDKEDGKEDNGWQELPQGAIKVEDSQLNINGESATGSVSFTALSPTTALLKMNDMIDGYSDVAVDLVMEKQADGTFKLTGTKEITTKPVTKSTNSTAPFLTVKIDGTISLAGKLTANITCSGPGLYIGTYKDKTLVLTYGDLVLVGKEVVYDGTNGSDVSLLLKDVIPGEPEAVLTGVQMSDSEFTGTATTTNATVKYTGSRANKVLTLKLEVTMKDTKGWAKTYKLADYTTGELTYNDYTNPNAVIAGGGYVNYVCVAGDSDYGTSYGMMFRGIFGALLPQVLKTVTLEADGNVTAEYIKAPKIQFDPMWAFMAPTEDVIKTLIPTGGWTKSVKNLAFWFEKDGKLYLKLNIGVIVSQAMGAQADGLDEIISMVLNSDAATLKDLLSKMLNIKLSSISNESINMLLDWVKNGVPMSVESVNGHTRFFLDKNAFDSLMKMREDTKTSDILALWQLLSDAKILPEEAAMAAGLISGISQNWTEAEAFELGLDLQVAN